MNAKEKFLNLKKAWIKASTTEREAIDAQMDTLFASLTEEGKADVRDAVSDDFAALKNEAKEIDHALNVREKLNPVLPFLSVSFLAKNYFHRTPQWFYQRLNGNRVNGKTSRFTDDELTTLDIALHDISHRLSAVKLYS